MHISIIFMDPMDSDSKFYFAHSHNSINELFSIFNYRLEFYRIGKLLLSVYWLLFSNWLSEQVMWNRFWYLHGLHLLRDIFFKDLFKYKSRLFIFFQSYNLKTNLGSIAIRGCVPSNQCEKITITTNSGKSSSVKTYGTCCTTDFCNYAENVSKKSNRLFMKLMVFLFYFFI